MSADGPISVRRAQRLVLEAVRRLPPERVSLAAALGRVLAAPISARRDLPPLDNSAMDGYAVRAADVEDGRPLPVVLDLPAGSAPATLAPGGAARIMTGAPLPDGADAVIPVEASVGPGGAGVFAAVGELVRFSETPRRGSHVRRRGEDVREGERVVTAGSVCTPGRIAVAAANGRGILSVVRRPRVAIVSTGDELVDLDEAGSAVGIVDGNAYGAAAQVAEAGGMPTLLPIVPDEMAAVRQAVEGALAADLVVTIGGVSAGARDFVPAALAAAGATFVFRGVAVRPGGPTAFATTPAGGVVIALPGNPVSASVAFELLARPALLKMAGHERCFRRPLRARLLEAVETPAEKTYVLRARLGRDHAGWTVGLTGPQGSGVASSLARAEALVVVPAETRGLPAGAEVEVLPIEDGAWTRTEEP